MGTRQRNRINQFCVLAASAVLVLSFSPADAADKCRTGCHGPSSNLFKYETGTTYKYSLDGHVDLSLSGAEQHTSTRLRATVLMSPMKDCQHLIRLKDVQIFGPDSKKYATQADLQKSVQMVFHDGHVDDEICAEPGDSQFSLNIKRAVISLFQAATKNYREVDLFGDCPTSFTTSNEGNMLVIHKSRDLNKCSHRESLRQDFMASSFNPYSEIKSSPLLNGDYTATQRVKNGVLEEAEVSEHYFYEPFSNGQNGAKATVTTKLKFVNKEKDNVQSKTTEPRSIIFENPHLVNTPTSNVNNLLNALTKALESSAGKSVKASSARDYKDFVNTMRVTSKDDIFSVFGQVRAGAGFKDVNVAKRLFLEALVRAGTGDTIEVSIQLLKNKQIPAEQQKLLYLGLAFVKHATSSSLGTAAGLLEQPNLPREAYLGIGNLAYRFCREHNCDNDQNLNKLTQKMMSKLTTCQTKNREEENEVIAILKGLANFGHLSDRILDKLVSCASDKTVPTRVRVVALETFRADAAKQKLKNAAIEILKDRELDAEIRIHAYLALVSAPCGQVANALKDLLATEPVNQVGSFIVTHLRNIRSSTNPDKESAKQHLSLLRSPKRFPIDFRRFSFNNEISYAINSLGLATQVESNVIYSQNSFLPRSVSLNITTEVFGHTFELFEVSLRQENLDRVVEHYLGPRGVLKTSSTGDLIEQSRAELELIFKKVKERMQKLKRGRRDVSRAELETFAKQVHLLTSPIDTELDLDLSLKLFGSEVSFLTFNEGVKRLSPDALVDKIFDAIESGVHNAKEFEFSATPHALFLDSEIAYPTSLGFPLKLAVVGSSAVSVHTSGKIDFNHIFQDPKNAGFQFNLVPSAAVEIVGTFTVDAFVVESGLKVASTIHTATGSELTVKLLNNGKGIDVKLGLPVESQDIITVTHEIVLATRELGHPEVEIPLKFAGQRKDYHGCFDQLSPLIGLTFCGDVGFPLRTLVHDGPQKGSAYFPLSGPAKFSLKINRDDAQQYHLRALYQDDVPGKRKFEVKFQTPNSKIDRKIDFIVEAAVNPEKMIKATLVSPIKTVTLEGHLIDTPSEQSVFVKFVQDQLEHSVKVGVSISGNAARTKYVPLIEVHTPTQKHSGAAKGGYSVEGAVIVEKSQKGRQYKFEKVRLNIPGESPMAIDGSVSLEEPHYKADVTVGHKGAVVTVKGALDAPNAQHIKLEGEMTNTLNPRANLKIYYETKRDNEKYDNKLTIVHGQDFASQTNRFHVESQGHYKYENRKSFDIAMNTEMSYPVLGISFKLGSHTTSTSFQYKFEVGYDKLRIANELDAKVNQKLPGDYAVNFYLDFVNNKITLEAKRDMIGSQTKSKHHIVLKVQDHVYQVDAVVENYSMLKERKLVVDATVKIHGFNEPLNVKYGQVLAPGIDIYAKVTSGSLQIVDVVFKSDRTANSNGHVKLHLGSYVDVNGEVDVKGGKGNANFLVHFKKSGRKMKAETTFTAVKPNFNVNFDIYFDFEKDPSKKIHFSTDNKIQEHSLDSKNTFEFFTYKTVVNMNGNFHGKLMDGKMAGVFDITFPTNHYLSGKINREIHNNNNIWNGDVLLELEGRENKNARGMKLSVHGVMKDTNFRAKNPVDLQYKVQFDHPNGKNLVLEVGGKVQPKANKRNYSLNFNLHGPLVPAAVTFATHGDIGPKDGAFEATFKLHDKFSLAFNKKFDFAASVENKYTRDIELYLELKNDPSQSFKISTTDTVLTPKTPADLLEMALSVAVVVNKDKSMKFDGSVRGNKEQGSGKVSVTLTDGHPITVSASYKRQAYDVLQFSTDITQYGDESKNVKFSITVNKPAPDQVTLKLNLITPVEAFRTIDITVNNKKSSDGKNIHTDVQLNANDKKYGVISEISLSETNPSFDIHYTCHDGSKSRIAAKLNRLGDRHASGELIILNIRDFSLEASGEANLESLDNFNIKMDINSEKLNLHNVHIDIVNKIAKGGKRIQFTAKSGNTNLVSGSTSYRAKEEGGKFIVEGAGTVKIREDSKSVNFKYIRKRLTVEKDGELGNEITLNMAVGDVNIVEELHVSNKQFHVLYSYCEEKKQCAHFEVTAKVHDIDIDNQGHELVVNVDLRKFGLNKEFGLKSVAYRKNFDSEHTVDVYFHAEEKQSYQYKMYVHPKSSGLILTMPKRVIAFESVVDVNVQEKKNAFSANYEFVAYFDKKNHPEQKTLLNANIESADNKESSYIRGGLKFFEPTIGKDLAITGHVNADKKTHTGNLHIDFDIFAKKEQKITVTGKVVVTPTGTTDMKIAYDAHVVGVAQKLQMDVVGEGAYTANEMHLNEVFTYKDGVHTAGYTFKFLSNPQNFELLWKTPTTDLVHVTSKIQASQKSLNAVSHYSLYGYKPLITEMNVKDYNTLTYTVYKKEKPEDKLHLTAGFIIGQLADIKTELVKGGTKKELFHYTMHLDDAQFMKTDYSTNVDNIKSYAEYIRKENVEFAQAIKALGEKMHKEITAELEHLLEMFKKVTPNFKPMLEFYKKQWMAIKEEIISDKTIKEISENIQKIFGAAIQAVSELFNKIAVVMEKINTVFTEHFTNIMNLLTKELIPLLKETFTKLFNVIGTIFETAANIVFTCVAKVLDIIKAHEAEFKELAVTFTEMTREIVRLVVKTVGQVHNEFINFVNAVIKQIKSLPIAEMWKEKYNSVTGNFEVPQYVYEVYKDIVNVLQAALPTPELQEVFKKTADYVEKKMKQVKVDDDAALKEIYTSFIRAIKSLLDYIRSEVGSENVSNFFNVGGGYGSLFKFNRLAPGQTSIVNFVQSDDLPTWSEMFLAYRPRLHFFDNFPPHEMHAMIIDGQHIFTFDERHLTFPGKCNYVLVQDYFDGNFSVTGNIVNGELHSITVSDEHDSITVKKDLSATINGAPSEYPQQTKHLFLWQRFYTVNIASDAGLHVTCGQNLKTCSFDVSGFYRSRVRGLLGNGNDEPYDDFILPNGKIATSEAEFGNAYKLSSSCPAIKTVDHSDHGEHHSSPICADMFGSDSSLRHCYRIINPTNFRQACEHAVAAGQQDSVCRLARAYAYACRDADLHFINAPAACVKCELGDRQVDYLDEVAVKPHGQADIIFVIEQRKTNENYIKDLINPVMQTLTNELKTKGITDVHYTLMGYGDGKWPAIFTNGGSINYQGKPVTAKFIDPKPHQPIKSGCNKLDVFFAGVEQTYDFLYKEFGYTAARRTYNDVLNYPFRPNALRAVIHIPVDCPPSSIAGLQQVRSSIYRVLLDSLDVQFNIILPLDTVKLNTKDQKVAKSFIGFSADSIYMYGDAKKSTAAQSALRSSLEYDRNHCSYLAEKTNGVVFSSTAFASSKGGQKKQYSQILGKAIVEQLTSVQSVRNCKCELKSGVIPEMKCKAVSRSEREQLARHTKGGVKG